MKWSVALRNTLIFKLAAIAVVAVIFFANRNTQKSFQQIAKYQRLVNEVKLNAATSRLKLQQFNSGDRSIGFDKEILMPLTASAALLERAYYGGPTAFGEFSEPDEDTKAAIKPLQLSLEKLLLASKALQQESATDLSVLNTVFENMMTDANKLADYYARRSAEIAGQAGYMNSAAMVLLVIAVAVSGFLFFRFQSKAEEKISSTQNKLSQEKNRVTTLSRFIEAISDGDYSIELDDKDETGLSDKLKTMRDKLKANAEEDQRRTWATTGLAQIGEILRQTSDAASLYDSVIKFAVNYTRSNQGGLFLLNDDDEKNPFLELVSAYAFERKKFITKRIDIGQGLVGQCYLEAARIFLTKLPEEYVSITSGLGGANPNCLLLVPLKTNDKVYGVIELASFVKYEEYQVQWVEKLAESVASTVSSVKVNESTRLLLERTQQQAEEMRAQEEEMRQNMEELSATQEELARKEREYIRRIQELENQVQVRTPAG